MKSTKILSIGWDVGGWMGSKQGFSMCLWDTETKQLKWIGKAKEMSLPKSHLISPLDIIADLTDGANFSKCRNLQVIVAIDAPLGYPICFVEFLNGKNVINARPVLEIENPLAYRETERHIHQKFGKKPLSSTFDKIGNNATVAISHINNWIKNDGFIRQPSHENGLKEIIEVYPALVKENAYLFQSFDEEIPNEINRGTDAYDSAICALMGLKYYVGEELFGMPCVSKLVKEEYFSEGWIYYLEGPNN